jgi:hypothetical protein
MIKNEIRGIIMLTVINLKLSRYKFDGEIAAEVKSRKRIETFILALFGLNVFPTRIPE